MSDKLLRLGKIGASLVLFVGMVGIFGWIFDIPLAKSLVPGWATMKLNTAIGFSALGLCLLLTDNQRSEIRKVRIALCALVLLLGTLTFIQYVLHLDFFIDNLLIRGATPTSDNPYPNRMSPVTAFCFMTLGLGLIGSIQPGFWRERVVQIASMLVIAASFTCLVGYVYGVSSLYKVSIYSSMAVHTAVAFLLSAVSMMMLLPASGIMAIFVAPTSAGTLARRLILTIPAAIFTVGCLSLVGEEMGLFDARFGLAIMVLACSTITILVVVSQVRFLEVAERARLRAHKARAVSDLRFRLSMESAPVAIAMADRDGNIVLANRMMCSTFQYRDEELIGKSIELLVPARSRSVHQRYRTQFADSSEVRRMAHAMNISGLRKDGTEVPIEVGLTPIHTKDGDFVIASVLDVTERHQRQLELEQTLEALERSNADLQRFAFVASHDLQTPLRSISGFVQLLQQEYGENLDERAKDWIQRTVMASKHMHRLIQDILAFSRLESEGRDFTEVELNEAVDETLGYLSASVKEKGAIMTVGKLPRVKGDRTQLVSVFQNLVGNAIKYCDTIPPKIDIAAERAGENWVVSVSDNGIGIAPEYREQIFDMFSRLHSQSEYSGTGIGLAISRRIAERHGGDLKVESAANGGSVFKLQLPCIEERNE